jgi:hypothetical protein
VGKWAAAPEVMTFVSGRETTSPVFSSSTKGCTDPLKRTAERLAPGAGSGRALQRYTECELRQTDRAGVGIGAREGLLERPIEVVVQLRRRGGERRAVMRVRMDADDLQPCETSNTNYLTGRRDPSRLIPCLVARRLGRLEKGKQIVGARSAPRGSWRQSARTQVGRNSLDCHPR